MSRRPNPHVPKTRSADHDKSQEKAQRVEPEQNDSDAEMLDSSVPRSRNGLPSRDKLALSRLDWTSVLLLALILLIAPMWAATFATPNQIPLLSPDEIAISGVPGIFLSIWTGSIVLLLTSAAFCIMVWREWKKPVAIGAVPGLAGAFALLGIWAILASARNPALYLSLNTLSFLFAALLCGGMISRLGRDHNGIAALLLTLAAAGSLVAGIGVNEYLQFWKQGVPEHRVFSTFLPDFLAGYLLLTLPVTLAAFTTIQPRSLRLALGVGLALQSACLLLTGSRAGIAIALFTVVFWLALCLFIGAAKGNGKSIRLALGFFSLGAVLGMAPILSRLGISAQPHPVPIAQKAPAASLAASAESQDHSSAFRKYTWIGTVRMAFRNPILGAGTGTFDIAYPRYAETAYTSHAHNSYLQWMGETGIPGVLLLLTGMAAACAFVVNILLIMRSRSREAEKSPVKNEIAVDDLDSNRLLSSPRILLAGLCAAFVASLLHSLFDSDWYIIATLLTFSTVLGLLIAQARALAPLATQMPRTLGREFGMIGLLLCAFMLWRGSETGWSRWQRAQMGHADSKQQAITFLRAASAADPFDPEPHLVLSQMLRGQPEADSQMQAAVQVVPSGRTYYLLGRYYADAGQWKPALDAFEQSRAFEPHNLQTLRALAETQIKAGQSDQARLTYLTISGLEKAPYGTVRAMPEMIETDFAYAYSGLGDIAAQNRNWPEAEKQYQQALRVLRAYWPTRNWSVNQARMLEKRHALVDLYLHVLQQLQQTVKEEGKFGEVVPLAAEQKQVEKDNIADKVEEEKANAAVQ